MKMSIPKGNIGTTIILSKCPTIRVVSDPWYPDKIVWHTLMSTISTDSLLNIRSPHLASRLQSPLKTTFVDGLAIRCWIILVNLSVVLCCLVCIFSKAVVEDHTRGLSQISSRVIPHAMIWGQGKSPTFNMAIWDGNNTSYSICKDI